MKKMRKLIPALAMLLVSAVMMSTASFAWFSMSTTATATGMKVQAKAGAGILITNSTGATWASSAASTQTGTKELLPTSTYDGTAWYSNTSSNAASANKNNTADTYEQLTASVAAESHYLYQDFYIKSSSNETLANDLQITNVSVTGNTTNLVKALRILVKCDETYYIFSTTGAQYKVIETMKGTGGATANDFQDVTPTGTGSVTGKTFGLSEIPNIDAVPNGTGTGEGQSGAPAVKVEVYIYFEGEDDECKSANLASVVDTLTVALTFQTAPKATPGT